MQETTTGLLGQRERLWPTIVVSLAIHAGAIGLAVVYRPEAIIDLDQKPIVAKLVRLGEKRPEQLLPRNEEAPPPPAEAPVPIPGPTPEPAPPPEPKEAPKPEPKAPPPEKEKGGAPDPKPSNVLAKALNRVRRDKALNEPTYGDPTGDSEGDSSDGSEGDRYLALVQRQITASYQLPTTLSEQERMYLKATVVLIIEPDGRISAHRFEKRSGNRSFDDALERNILKIRRLPPPPSERREHYRTQGAGLIFTAK